MTRAAKRPWLAMLLSLLMLISVITPAMAQTPEITQADAVQFLRDYQIVQGDETGNLNLDKTITRAELAKITVIAMGQGGLAPMLASSVSFADSVGHWGAGYIETASRLGLIKGRDANTFDPNAPITYAEAYTILLRMVGREPAGPWNANSIMQAAAGLGMVPNASLEFLAGVPAVRGPLFEGLTRTMTNVKLADGKTLAGKHLDSEAPELTVSAPAATADETVTVTGTANGASAVLVNGVAATLTGNRFSAVVSVQMGTNTLNVVAVDRAGNETAKSVTVVRGGDVAAISISGPTSVKAGESAVLTVKPTDAQGRALPSSVLTATVADGMGSFDTATSTFKAGSKAGVATITFVASTGVTEEYAIDVLGLAAEAAGLRIRTASLSKGITVGKSGDVQVEVVNAEGNPVTYDDGRLITLHATGLAGVSPSSSTARTVAGVATFKLSGSQVGEAALEATSTGLTAATASVQFASSTRVVLTADPSSLTANGSELVVIRATLENSDGKAVPNNTGADIFIDLDVPAFDGFVSSSSIRIPRGVSSSAGNDGQLISGYKTEAVKIGGTMRSNHEYTIVPATVSFKEVTIGSATRFDISGGAGRLTPGQVVNLTVRVTDKDGNSISSGDVAFQVKVSTSNNEELVGGLPEGLEVYLGDNGPTPVVGAEDAVVARTTKGSAKLTLVYDKSGIVNVEIVGVQATEDAWDDQGYVDKATAGTNFSSASREIMYAAAAVSDTKVTADLTGSDLKGQTVGVLPANSRGRATVKVYLVDNKGGWIPNASGPVTLSRVTAGDADGENSRISGSTTVNARNGVAEFTLLSTQVAGADLWKATFDGKESTESLTIATATEKLDQPFILNITGDQSGYENRVTLDDTGMQIDFTGYGTGANQVYGYVKVYRSGSTTPIYTSNVLDLYSAPYVVVPKEKMQASDHYLIAVNNGVGDSAKSFSFPDDTSLKVVVEKEASISITGVQYDAAHTMRIDGVDQTVSRLYVTAKGVASSGTIDPSKLILRQTVTGYQRYLDQYGAVCTASSGSFTCTFGEELDAEDFNGSVILDTENGWYIREASGETAGRDEVTTDNRVTPTAFITYASVSFGTNSKGETTGVLTVNGTNLTQGTINLSKITLGSGLSVGTTKPSSVSANKFTVNLPLLTAKTLYEGTAVTLSATAGWLYTNSYDNAGLTDRPVLIDPKIDSIAYSGGTLVIRGSGFGSADIDPSKLLFLDRRFKDDGETATLNTEVQKLTAAAVSVDPDGKTITITLGTALDNALKALPSGTVYVTSDGTDLTDSWYAEGTWLGSPLPRTRLTW